MERNVRLLSLNLDKVFEYTPLQDWWREDLRYTLSIWKSVHLSEVARYEVSDQNTYFFFKTLILKVCQALFHFIISAIFQAGIFVEVWRALSRS